MTSIVVPNKGPADAQLIVVGEAPGEQEEAWVETFAGPGGNALMDMLSAAGINPKEVLFTNVFNVRPPKNNVDFFFTKKTDKERNFEEEVYGRGKYLHSNYNSHLTRVRETVALSSAKLVICLGNTALWAFTGKTGIGALRGSFLPSHCVAPPILATYHPAAVLRDWTLRSTCIADFQKAKDFLDGKISTPSNSYKLHLNPTKADLLNWREIFRAHRGIYGVDVETAYNQIRTVGIATARDCAYVIPFFDTRAGVVNYWDTAEEEHLAWQIVFEVMTSDNPKVFHNGLYDMQRLFLPYGIIVRNAAHDSLLLHHAQQPEMKKDLQTLSSFHLNTSPWKTEYRRGSKDQTKRDE